MHILVAVKRVLDYRAKVKLQPDGSGFDLQGAKMAMNPFDEIALEAALRLREAGHATQVSIVTAGEPAAEEVLRTGLAMGADRAILLSTSVTLQPLGVARLLARLAEDESPDLYLLGKQSIDGDHNQTGQLLAAFLGWPQATFASEIEMKPPEIWVTREVDGGHMTVAVQPPAVITADLRLNVPRFVSLPNIMKAKRAPITKIDLAQSDWDIDYHPKLVTETVRPPAERAAGQMVNSVPELVDAIRAKIDVLG